MKILAAILTMLAMVLPSWSATVYPASTNGANVFTGTNTFTTKIIATNTLGGFIGNGPGLTNLMVTNVVSVATLSDTNVLIFSGGDLSEITGPKVFYFRASPPSYTNSTGTEAVYPDSPTPTAWAMTNNTVPLIFSKAFSASPLGSWFNEVTADSDTSADYGTNQVASAVFTTSGSTISTPNLFTFSGGLVSSNTLIASNFTMDGDFSTKFVTITNWNISVPVANLSPSDPRQGTDTGLSFVNPTNRNKRGGVWYYYNHGILLTSEDGIVINPNNKGASVQIGISGTGLTDAFTNAQSQNVYVQYSSTTLPAAFDDGISKYPFGHSHSFSIRACDAYGTGSFPGMVGVAASTNGFAASEGAGQLVLGEIYFYTVIPMLDNKGFFGNFKTYPGIMTGKMGTNCWYFKSVYSTNGLTVSSGLITNNGIVWVSSPTATNATTYPDGSLATAGGRLWVLQGGSWVIK